MFSLTRLPTSTRCTSAAAGACASSSVLRNKACMVCSRSRCATLTAIFFHQQVPKFLLLGIAQPGHSGLQVVQALLARLPVELAEGSEKLGLPFLFAAGEFHDREF